MKKSKLISMCLGLLVPFTSLMGHYEYDYIVVGNGTAGAVLARKLSDNHKKKVLVLEAGINHDDDPKVLSPNPFEFITDLTYDPQYAETYDVPLGTGLFATIRIYSEGKGWGGSSMHNGLLAVRGTPRVYDFWADFSGNPAWSYDQMLPLMIALENYTPCQTPLDPNERGVGGPISLTQQLPVTTDPLAILLAATSNAGFTDDYNSATAVSTTGHLNLGGCAIQGFVKPAQPCTFVGGMRSFSSLEFLTPSVVTPEGEGVDGRLLHIESNCYVSRVIFKGHKAIGVEFVFGQNGTKCSKAYGKKIILCAGAINSPAILQRSGIGDAALLESLGIKVLVDNPHVGEHLINQYGPIAIVNVPTTPDLFQVFASGSANPPLPAPFNYPNDDVRRLQIIGGDFGASLAFSLLTVPKSEGFVRINSRNQFDHPDIDLGIFNDNNSPTPYLVNGTDANLAMTALKIVEQAVGNANMIVPPPATFGSDAALWDYLQTPSGIQITYHVTSTTRMAQSIEDGVVDGNLNVFGVKNLMVADIGVLPIPNDGNTCYAAYMVGLRAATILGRDVPPAL